jgi:DUF1680 family protein
MAFPATFFDNLEALKPDYNPAYYMAQKLMQGLYDIYQFTGNKDAIDIVIKMADYFYNRIQNIINKYTIHRWWKIASME